MLNIRIANEKDIPKLLPLMVQLGYPAALKEFKERFAVFTSMEGYGVAVAIISDKVVGFVAWSKSTLIVADKVRIRIEGLVVDERYRGCGVGKKLMGFVEGFANSASPAIIEITSGIRRAEDGVHEFYGNIGYTNAGPMAKLYLRKEIIS